MALTSPGTPKTVLCFLNQTADETLGPWIDVRGYPNVTFYLTGSNATISSGVISIEEAAPIKPNEPVYGTSTGEYSLIGTQNADTLTDGVQLGYHLPSDRAYYFVRVRISTAIGGGGNASALLVAY